MLNVSLDLSDLPYRCPKCGNRSHFNSLGQLKEHLENQHPSLSPTASNTRIGRATSPLTVSFHRDREELERKLRTEKEAEQRFKLQSRLSPPSSNTGSPTPTSPYRNTTSNTTSPLRQDSLTASFKITRTEPRGGVTSPSLSDTHIGARVSNRHVEATRSRSDSAAHNDSKGICDHKSVPKWRPEDKAECPYKSSRNSWRNTHSNHNGHYVNEDVYGSEDPLKTYIHDGKQNRYSKYTSPYSPITPSAEHECEKCAATRQETHRDACQCYKPKDRTVEYAHSVGTTDRTSPVIPPHHGSINKLDQAGLYHDYLVSFSTSMPQYPEPHITSGSRKHSDAVQALDKAKLRIESLKKTADEFTAEQQQSIDRLRDELGVKDAELLHGNHELEEMRADRVSLQRHVRDLEMRQDRSEDELMKLRRELRDKDDLIDTKQSEVSSLTQYLDEARRKENTAKDDLQAFISELQERAQTAEGQLRALTRRIQAQDVAQDTTLLQPEPAQAPSSSYMGVSYPAPLNAGSDQVSPPTQPCIDTPKQSNTLPPDKPPRLFLHTSTANKNASQVRALVHAPNVEDDPKDIDKDDKKIADVSGQTSVVTDTVVKDNISGYESQPVSSSNVQSPGSSQLSNHVPASKPAGVPSQEDVSKPLRPTALGIRTQYNIPRRMSPLTKSSGSPSGRLPSPEGLTNRSPSGRSRYPALGKCAVGHRRRTPTGSPSSREDTSRINSPGKKYLPDFSPRALYSLKEGVSDKLSPSSTTSSRSTLSFSEKYKARSPMSPECSADLSFSRSYIPRQVNRKRSVEADTSSPKATEILKRRMLKEYREHHPHYYHHNPNYATYYPMHTLLVTSGKAAENHEKLHSPFLCDKSPLNTDVTSVPYTHGFPEKWVNPSGEEQNKSNTFPLSANPVGLEVQHSNTFPRSTLPPECEVDSPESSPSEEETGESHNVVRSVSFCASEEIIEDPHTIVRSVSFYADTSPSTPTKASSLPGSCCNSPELGKCSLPGKDTVLCYYFMPPSETASGGSEPNKDIPPLSPVEVRKGRIWFAPEDNEIHSDVSSVISVSNNSNDEADTKSGSQDSLSVTSDSYHINTTCSPHSDSMDSLHGDPSHPCGILPDETHNASVSGSPDSGQGPSSVDVGPGITKDQLRFGLDAMTYNVTTEDTLPPLVSLGSRSGSATRATSDSGIGMQEHQVYSMLGVSYPGPPGKTSTPIKPTVETDSLPEATQDHTYISYQQTPSLEEFHRPVESSSKPEVSQNSAPHAESIDEIQRQEQLLHKQQKALKQQLRAVAKQRQQLRASRTSTPSDTDDITSITDMESSITTDLSEITSRLDELDHKLGVPSSPGSVPPQKASLGTMTLPNTSRKPSIPWSVGTQGSLNIMAFPGSESHMRKVRRRKRRQDALFCVFMYLDTKTLCLVGRVCRDWYTTSRHPALWRKVDLRYVRLTSSFLKSMATWSTQLQSITLEGLKRRRKRKDESASEHAKNTRGALESGLEVLLATVRDTLLSLRVVDCGNLLTERCLWLASCHSRRLERLAYISEYEPVGSEVIWALGAGCRRITTLIVPPMFPCKNRSKFNNRCVQMIGRCWPQMRVLCVGGVDVDEKGLIAIARHCQRLQVLELDHMLEVCEEVAIAMCSLGLKNLEVLDLTFTPITPKAALYFLSNCNKLNTLSIHVGISDYYDDTKSVENRLQFKEISRKLHALRSRKSFAEILTVKTDYG